MNSRRAAIALATAGIALAVQESEIIEVPIHNYHPCPDVDPRPMFRKDPEPWQKKHKRHKGGR